MILPNRVLIPGKGAMKQGVVVNVGQEFLDVNVDNVVSDYWTVDVRRVTETDSESVIEGQLFVLKDQRGTHRIDVVKVSYVGPVQEIPLVVGQGGNRFLGKFCFFYRYYMVACLKCSDLF